MFERRRWRRRACVRNSMEKFSERACAEFCITIIGCPISSNNLSIGTIGTTTMMLMMVTMRHTRPATRRFRFAHTFARHVRLTCLARRRCTFNRTIVRVKSMNLNEGGRNVGGGCCVVLGPRGPARRLYRTRAGDALIDLRPGMDG